MLQTTSLTVLAGSDTSNICDTGINQVVAFIFPSTMTATSASLTVSLDGVNFHTVVERDTSTPLALSVYSAYQFLSPELSYSMPRFIQLILDDTEAADRTIQVVTREV